MANHDFIMPYGEEMRLWLAARDYPRPDVRPNNRFPTKQEVLEAIEESGILRAENADEREFFAVEKSVGSGGAYLIRIGSSGWDQLGESKTGSITMHGSFCTELLLVEILARRCGQLLICPDTGDPAVIVTAGMDVDRVYAVWTEANKQTDSWRYFYRAIGY